MIALFGLVFGATLAEEGPLRLLREQIQRAVTQEQHALTVGDVVGADWLVYPCGALILIWLVRSPVTSPDKAWSWPTTGSLMGLLGIVAWVLSTLSGRSFGMAIIPGSVDMLEFVAAGDTARLSWDVFFVLAIPAGAYLGVRRGSGTSEPIAGGQMLKALGGGLALGIGASFAAGCTVGHSLVGIPLLSVGSIVTTVFIVLGSWTVGYAEIRRGG